MFTEFQKRELREIIETHFAHLIGINLGFDILSPDEKQLLKTYGFDPDEKLEWPPFFQSFMFGRLAAYLSDYQLQQINYNDFKQYLLRHQYIRLIDDEIEEYNLARQKTYQYIKNIEQKIVGTLNQSILNEEQKQNVIKETKKLDLLNKESVKQIISTLVHKTGVANVDWGKLIDTEMHDVYSRGKAIVYQAHFGNNQRVYKQTYAGACRWCIKLHLSNGIGSEPIAYTLEELYQNGSNIGKKPQDWKAVIGSTHPFCRCDLRVVYDDEVWDEKKKKYIVQSTKKDKSKVIVYVGDKKFII